MLTTPPILLGSSTKIITRSTSCSSISLLSIHLTSDHHSHLSSPSYTTKYTHTDETDSCKLFILIFMLLLLTHLVSWMDGCLNHLRTTMEINIIFLISIYSPQVKFMISIFFLKCLKNNFSRIFLNSFQTHLQSSA